MPLCGTFGYIYWELGRSAPGGGGRPGCAALTRERGTCPLIRPLRGHLPPRGKAYGRVKTPASTEIVDKKRRAHNVRPYTAFTNGSIYKKRDRSRTCPLKHRGETQFRRKFLCLLSFSKKVGYTGPWRKRSIISWVREMADPPWGRFSRSNQVPSPSSSS